jgi:hypothetical protein
MRNRRLYMFLPRIEGDKWLVNLIAILDAVYPTWARLSNQPRRVSWAERVNLALAAKKRQISDQAGRHPGNVGPGRFCHKWVWIAARKETVRQDCQSCGALRLAN